MRQLLQKEKDIKMILKKSKRFFSLLTALTLLGTALSGCKVVERQTDVQSSVTDEAATSVVLKPDTGEVIYKSAHFEINDKMTRCFMYDIADQLVSTSGSYIEMSGGELMDFSKSMKEQYIMTDTTWYDYCSEILGNYVKEYLVLAECALDNGMALTDVEEGLIDEWAKSFDESKYDGKVSGETAGECMKIKSLAMKYATSQLFDAELTQDEVDKYYAENKKFYTTVNYRYFSLNYASAEQTEAETETSADTSEDEEDVTLNAEQAEDIAKSLKECKTEDEFVSCLTAKMKQYYPNMSEDEIKDAIEGTDVSGQSYQEGYDELDWMFADERAVGDVYYDHDDENMIYTVIMMTDTMIEETSETINVRHILIMSEEEETEGESKKDDEAKAKADEIMGKLKAQNNDTAVFKLLAMLYSEDPGSSMMGGYYECVVQGEMVEEFDEWCFDKSRQKGDCDIVKTDYGYHIMCFEGKGLTASVANARSQLLSDKYSEQYEKLIENVTVDSDTDKYKAMEF